jgi:hypothetical protein
VASTQQQTGRRTPLSAVIFNASKFFGLPNDVQAVSQKMGDAVRALAMCCNMVTLAEPG